MKGKLVVLVGALSASLCAGCSSTGKSPAGAPAYGTPSASAPFLTPVEVQDAVADRLRTISGQAGVAEAIRNWESCSTESEREQALLHVAEVLASTGLTSDVRFRTSLPGAKVQYQLISRQIPQEVFGATNDSRVANLPIGYYFVWTQRDARPTSTKRRYSIIDAEPPPILIPEDVP